jgi:hypothetical protein
MRRSSIMRTVGIVLIALGAVAGAGTLVVRDQMTRHRRNLFSSQALQRLAALGYLSGAPATVELVQLLRDYCSWEQNTILRKRATPIVTRMERDLEAHPTLPTGIAG